MKTILFFLILFNLAFSDEKIINENLPLEKSKEYYENNQNLLEEIPEYKENNQEKKEDKKIDGDVKFNKDTKSIDSVNINIGSKF